MTEYVKWAEGILVMTESDIIKIAKIMLTADSWCTGCNSNLINKLILCFPEHTKAIQYVSNRQDDLHQKFNDVVEKYWDGTHENDLEPQIWEIG